MRIAVTLERRERDRVKEREGGNRWKRTVRQLIRASTHAVNDQIQTLRITSSISPPPPPIHPPPPPPTQRTARAVGFYLSCVQAQASVKRAEESAGASALSSGRETRASITCNLATSACLIHCRWMAGQRGECCPATPWLIHHIFHGRVF